MDKKIPAAFGKVLGEVTITTVTLPIFSNGDSLFVSDQKTYDATGRYLGIAYHCVEFVRRYVYERHSINLANFWHDGDADDWYTNRTTMPLQKVTLTDCKPGDIVTFTGEKTGHIAIVKEVSDEGLVIASQNLTNSPLDLHTILDHQILTGQQPLVGQDGLRFFFEAVMRCC
jgi:hypothetical protein